jgi:hypothetical protein
VVECVNLSELPLTALSDGELRELATSGESRVSTNGGTLHCIDFGYCMSSEIGKTETDCGPLSS